jgi:DnaK suppressor protein
VSAHLQERDLEDLRAALLRKRNELVGAIDAHRDEGRGVSGEEIEDGDVAERMVEQDDALRLTAHDAALVAEIDHALRRLDAGSYGTSEESGAPIPLDRLRAVPWARRTFEEEQRHTRR